MCLTASVPCELQVDVALTCCDFQKAQMSELLKVLLPRSRFAEPGGTDQVCAYELPLSCTGVGVP